MNQRLLFTEPIAKELESFNHYYKQSIVSENARVQEIISYTLKSDGKRIRPILLLLAAKASGEVNDVTYQAAITIELLHAASLIHDDVVDESKIRRGQASLNAVYDNKMAVLAGDYFLSTALIKSVMTGNIEIISNISALGRSLAEGELNQLSLAKESILSEKEYFDVIKNKTASLLSTCMRIGALSVNSSDEDVAKFTQLGEILGICFQLRDDIFDYFKQDVGKPTGNDIRDGKVTLPLLFALSNTSSDVSKPYLDIIKSNDYTDQNVEVLINFAIDNKGIDYAYSKIAEYGSRAEVLINSTANNQIRTALQRILDYIVDRTY